MSRKDFVALAQAIRKNLESRQQREILANAIIPTLKASNPRFDSNRFIAAAVGD